MVGKLLYYLKNLLFCWIIVIVTANQISCETVVRLSYDDLLKTGVNVAQNDNWNGHSIYKRSTSSGDNCPTLKEQAPGLPTDLTTASKTHQFAAPSDGSSDYNAITMVWTGENNATRVVGLLDIRGVVHSSVYQSKENTNSFTESTGLEGVVISIMDTNPSSKDHVIIIGSKNNTYQSCVSNDAGTSFECHVILESYAPAGTLLFNNHMVMTIMKSESFNQNDLALVLSKDYGKSWAPIDYNVKAAVFHPNNPDIILALISAQDSSPFSAFGFNLFGLSSSSQLKKINVTDVEHPNTSSLEGLLKTTVTGFQYAGNFLHVVTQDEDGHKVLKVSKDHGSTFTDTHLPAVASGQYINILHTADDLIFAHVTDVTDENIGTLYTSGQEGIFYTASLTDHISDDFYVVSSMHGVYISTQQQLDSSLVTKISLNRGSEWSDVTLKDCTKPSACTIQIYNKFLIALHRTNENEVLAQAPHSSKNARGLIVVQGVLAESIPYNTATRKYNYDAVKVLVFISGDGGYSWIQAPESLVGAHHLLIEDSGGVIQALPMRKQLEHIKFSVDEGKCWYVLPINQDKITNNFTIKALVSQPGQQSLKLGIIGHGQVNTKQISWIVIDVDFKQMISRQCGSGDLEEWDDHPSCYLGIKRTYRRIKKTSWCYLGPKANVSYSSSICACERKDYECDYGFIKQDNAEKSCKKDPKFKDEVTYCLDNKIYQLISYGYRKVPGDQCNVNDPKSVVMNTDVNTKNLNQACDEGDPDTYLSLDAVKMRICGPPSQSASTDGKRLKSPGLVAAVVFLTLLATILCVVLGVVFIRYRKLQRQYDYGTFDSSPWEVDGDNRSGAAAASSGSETFRISNGDNTGRSYSRLKESGVESDVDLLNM